MAFRYWKRRRSKDDKDKLIDEKELLVDLLLF